VTVTRRWPAVITLLIIVLISYIDRVNVSVLITDRAFTDHFGLTGRPAAQGLLMTLFLLGNGVAAFLLSPVYETRLGVRRGLLLSIALWAALTLVSPFALGGAMLLTLRFLLGTAEGPLFSLKTMYIRDAFTDREVGKPNAVSSMGVSLGTAVGLPLVTFLVYRASWASSFLVLAALNAVVGLPLIALTVRGVRRRAAATDGAALMRFRQALRTPRLGWILAVEIATLAFLWGSSSWLPSYLLHGRHFTLVQTGIVSSLPFLLSLVSGLAGGALIDRIAPRRVPLLLVCGGLGTAASILVVVFASGPVVATLGLVLANGFWGLQAPVIPTLVQHNAAPGTVGSTYGVVNGIGNLVSAFMPTLMGAAISAGGSHGYAYGYLLLVGTQLVTLVVGILLIARRRKPAMRVTAALPSKPSVVDS
jgi:MFS family permease